MEKFLEYNQWSNEIYAHYIQEINLASRKVIANFSHILNSHHIWNQRILNNPVKIKPWDLMMMNEFFEINRANTKATLDLLKSKSLSDIVQYENSKGKKFENTVEEIILHICNHSTYHRAQIGEQMKKFKVTPPVTDYIAYLRTAQS